MTTKAKLMGLGIAAQVANHVVGNVTTGLVAAGTTQADALALPGDLNQFSTVASGAGASLSFAAQPGDTFTVYNGGANALLIYPPSGLSAQINGLSANAGYSLAVNKQCSFTNWSATQWASNLSA